MNSEPSASNHLTFIERFIAQHYLRQPAWVRAITFSVFVGLFAFAFLRIIAGEVVLTGTIFEVEVDHKRPPARNYDVHSGVGDRLVGTNSKGEYHLIVSNSEALAILVRGALTLAVADKNDNRLGKYDVKLKRFPLELDDLFLDDQASKMTARSPLTSGSGAYSFATTAYAQEVDDRRLFVSELRAAFYAHALVATAFCRSTEIPLLSSRAKGLVAGPIPISFNQNISYDLDYYFDLPTDCPGSQIKLTTESSRLFGLFKGSSSETLALPERWPVDGDILLHGDRGSRLLIRVARVSIDTKAALAKAGAVGLVRGIHPSVYGDILCTGVLVADQLLLTGPNCEHANSARFTVGAPGASKTYTVPVPGRERGYGWAIVDVPIPPDQHTVLRIATRPPVVGELVTMIDVGNDPDRVSAKADVCRVAVVLDAQFTPDCDYNGGIRFYISGAPFLRADGTVVGIVGGDTNGAIRMDRIVNDSRVLQARVSRQ